MSDSNLAAFLHAAAGGPTKATVLAAIQNGNFTMWPGLTPSLIAKHLLPSIATGKGHMKQEQQRLQSTRLESTITPHSSPRVHTQLPSPCNELNYIYHPDTGTRQTYDSLRKTNKARWERSFANEIGRLAQGVAERMKSGNDNKFFIPKSAMVSLFGMFVGCSL